METLARVNHFLSLHKKFRNSFSILVLFAQVLPFAQKAEASFSISPIQPQVHLSSLVLFAHSEAAATQFLYRKLTQRPVRFSFNTISSNNFIPFLNHNQSKSARTQFSLSRNIDSMQKQLRNFEHKFLCLKAIYQSV